MKSLQYTIKESLRIGINDKPEDESGISLIKELKDEIDFWGNSYQKGKIINKIFTDKEKFEKDFFNTVKWRCISLLKYEHDVNKLKSFIDEMFKKYKIVYNLALATPHKWMHDRLKDGINYLDCITSIYHCEINWGRFEDGYLIEIKDEKNWIDELFIATDEDLEDIL